jgi:hypothetical protein
VLGYDGPFRIKQNALGLSATTIDPNFARCAHWADQRPKMPQGKIFLSC